MNVTPEHVREYARWLVGMAEQMERGECVITRCDTNSTGDYERHRMSVVLEWRYPGFEPPDMEHG